MMKTIDYQPSEDNSDEDSEVDKLLTSEGKIARNNAILSGVIGDGCKYISKELKKQFNNINDLIVNEDQKKEVFDKLFEKAKSKVDKKIVLDYYQLSEFFEQLYISTKNGLEISKENITRIQTKVKTMKKAERGIQHQNYMAARRAEVLPMLEISLLKVASQLEIRTKQRS